MAGSLRACCSAASRLDPAVRRNESAITSKTRLCGRTKAWKTDGRSGVPNFQELRVRVPVEYSGIVN
jgi:hypothetical protein